jgi:hypothetical protein
MRGGGRLLLLRNSTGITDEVVSRRVLIRGAQNAETSVAGVHSLLH